MLDDDLSATLWQEVRDLAAAASRHVAALAGAARFDPAFVEHFDALYRAAHTLKGLGGLFGLDDLARAADALEDTLDTMRAEALPCDRESHARLVDEVVALARCVDARRLPVGTDGGMPGAMFDRLAWEVERLARPRSKEVRLVVTGSMTALTGRICAALVGPLQQLISNAVEHGIEPPARRTALGKARSGTIQIRVASADAQFVLEIEDDGAGVDGAEVRRGALARGRMDAAAAEAMSERELLVLLFQPGVTTRGAVTMSSGRGVGLDVVCGAVRRLGGSVDIESEHGRFTRVTLKVPLT